MWEAKNENVHELLGDDNNRPSFDYRETFYTIGDGKVVVYEDGFLTDEVRMTYYRNPVRVDLAGYINAAGERSTYPVFSSQRNSAPMATRACR